MKEEWREIEDYPDYEVSNLGRVRSYKVRGHSGYRRDEPVVLAPTRAHDGYVDVSLYNDEGMSTVQVHTLVLESFVGPCPKGMECRHWDGNKLNNDARNLLWGTRLENASDRIRHGTDMSGSRNPNAIEVSAKAIIEIKKRYGEGESILSIAEDFPDLSHGVVRRVANGTHWSVRGD